MTAYFMGVWPSPHGEVGHCCRIPTALGHYVRPGAPASPWSSTYAPLGEVEAVEAAWGPSAYRGPQTEGIGRVVVRDGWTLLCLWDRSGDPRGNCSASFAFWALLTPEEAIAEARERFPEVWTRIDAHLVRCSISLRLEVVADRGAE